MCSALSLSRMRTHPAGGKGHRLVLKNPRAAAIAVLRRLKVAVARLHLGDLPDRRVLHSPPALPPPKRRRVHCVRATGTRPSRSTPGKSNGTRRPNIWNGSAPCSAASTSTLPPQKVAQKTVKAKRYFTKVEDALNKEWHGRIFMNPPYSRDGMPRESFGRLVSTITVMWLSSSGMGQTHLKRPDPVTGFYGSRGRGTWRR